MPDILRFAYIHQYSSRDGSVVLPVALRVADHVVDLVASLDTGASFCLFESAYAEQLGLDLTSGLPLRFRTANSTFEAFGHEVDIEVLGMVTRSVVYFFADPTIVKNVLGRAGWLDRVRLGLIEHDCRLYLSEYADD